MRDPLTALGEVLRGTRLSTGQQLACLDGAGVLPTVVLLISGRRGWLKICDTMRHYCGKGTLMVETGNPGGIAQDLSLDGSETVVLLTMQLAMMNHDLAVEKSAEARRVKMATRDVFAAAAVDQLKSLLADEPVGLSDFAAAFEPAAAWRCRDISEYVPVSLGREVDRRSRALLLLIELFTFEPWPAKTHWIPKARRQSLEDSSALLPALRARDLHAVTRESSALRRRLRRKSVHWPRVAVGAVIGIGVGALTAGWAAPMIGAAIGGAAGLSGAAATSAGLATIGGGSIAAGGSGVAGGTALLTTLGGVTVGGAAAAGTRMSSWSSGQVAVDAIKLGLVTRLIYLDAEGDEEKAKRVVESLQSRLSEVSVKVNELAERMQGLSEKNEKLTAENNSLRSQLGEERAHARFAEMTLRVVLARLLASR